MPSRIAVNTAAIIVNYNGWQDTLRCVHSLLQSDTVPGCLVVVDNHSTDDSFEQIYRWARGEIPIPLLPKDHPLNRISSPKPLLTATFQMVSQPLQSLSFSKPTLLLYQTPGNSGYAGGVNAGIQLVWNIPEINWFWILNNDVMVHPGALQALLQCTRQSASVGIWGSKLLDFDNPQRIQAIGGRYYTCLALPTHIGQGEIDHGQYDRPVAIDYVVGAAMLVSRSFLAQVGLLNENYFLYFEEMDWVARGKKLGMGVAYCWKSRVYHKEGAVTGGSHKQSKSELSDFYFIRNRLLFTRKYYPWCLPLVYLSFLGVIIRRMLRGQWQRIPKILKILISHEI